MISKTSQRRRPSESVYRSQKSKIFHNNKIIESVADMLGRISV